MLTKRKRSATEIKDQVPVSDKVYIIKAANKDEFVYEYYCEIGELEDVLLNIYSDESGLYTQIIGIKLTNRSSITETESGFEVYNWKAFSNKGESGC